MTSAALDRWRTDRGALLDELFAAHLSLSGTGAGLAHDDQAKVAKVEAADYRIDLVSMRRWLSALDGLAGTMNDVLAAHLARLFETAPPW